MGIKTVIECDGNGCAMTAQFQYDEFNVGDLPDINWHFDVDNWFYYCPHCVKKMVANGELIEQ